MNMQELKAREGQLEDDIDVIDTQIEKLREERIKKMRELHDVRDAILERRLANQSKHSWLGKLIQGRTLPQAGMTS